VIQLTENEEIVLKSLGDGKQKTVEEIVAQTGLQPSTVSSAIESLAQNGLIQKTLVKRVYAELTDRGKTTSILPEDALFTAVGEKTPVAEAKSASSLKESDFNIAIAWGVKRGLLRFDTERGQRFITKGVRTDTISETFSFVKQMGRIQVDSNRKDLEVLKERQIVTIKESNVSLVCLKPGVSLSTLIIVRRQTVLTHKDLVTDTYKTLELPAYSFAPKKEPFFNRGKKHFYTEFLDIVKELLISLGFEEMYGPYLEYEFWNFDALFVPQDHVARDLHNSYKITNSSIDLGSRIPVDLTARVGETHLNGWRTGSTGWGGSWDASVTLRKILRSHTTAVSARRLAEKNFGSDFKYFTIDRNFRRDAVDATHLPDFQQCEGIVGGRNLSLRSLFGFLEMFSKKLGVSKIKFKPAYFPFTEPSVEPFIYHEKLGWVEAGGGGIFRPEVTLPLGIDFPVLAWGIGINRFAMLYYNLDDIRHLITQDLDEILSKEEAQIKFANS
jgi:phenylalanyl-tRNA synthetase alpha chain